MLDTVLPDDNVIAKSKLTAFADDNFNVAWKKNVFDRVEIIMGRVENANINLRANKSWNCEVKG